MRRKTIQFLLVLATLGIAALARSQNQSFIAQDASGQAGGNASQSRTSAVRILRPRAGQVLTNNFVNVRFELVRPNPTGGDNNFVIQLDSHDSVKTSETEYTFTGMRPGEHMIAVTEVDANGTPLPDARAGVQFSVNPPEGTVPPATPRDSKGTPAK